MREVGNWFSVVSMVSVASVVSVDLVVSMALVVLVVVDSPFDVVLEPTSVANEEAGSLWLADELNSDVDAAGWVALVL